MKMSKILGYALLKKLCNIVNYGMYKAFDSIYIANISHQWPSERQCRSHNNVIYKDESKISLTRWRHRLLRRCGRCAPRRYISPTPFYYLPRLRALDVYRFNEIKRFQAGKGKKQKIACTSNERHWHSLSDKFTRLSRIPATWSRTSSRWHRPQCKRRLDRIHVL